VVDVLNKVHQFNLKAGLLDKGYVDSKECAFPIEESLEGFNLTILAEQLQSKSKDPKYLSRRIMEYIHRPEQELEDVDRLDKHLDTIVYAIGSIYKLGLTPELFIEALDAVSEANLTKLSVGVDSAGKQMKPKDFISPEAQLQLILDKRK